MWRNFHHELLDEDLLITNRPQDILYRLRIFALRRCASDVPFFQLLYLRVL